MFKDNLKINKLCPLLCSNNHNCKEIIFITYLLLYLQSLKSIFPVNETSSWSFAFLFFLAFANLQHFSESVFHKEISLNTWKNLTVFNEVHDKSRHHLLQANLEQDCVLKEQNIYFFM